MHIVVSHILWEFSTLKELIFTGINFRGFRGFRVFSEIKFSRDKVIFGIREILLCVLRAERYLHEIQLSSNC